MTHDEIPLHPTLAQKLDQLFHTRRAPDGHEYTLEEVSKGIRAQSNISLSVTYLWELRRGAKDDPRKKHLESLAKFFNVPVMYFFDDVDGEAARMYARLATLQEADATNVQRIAFRAVDLNPGMLQALAGMIEHARHFDGVDDSDDAATRGKVPEGTD